MNVCVPKFDPAVSCNPSALPDGSAERAAAVTARAPRMAVISAAPPAATVPTFAGPELTWPMKLMPPPYALMVALAIQLPARLGDCCSPGSTMTIENGDPGYFVVGMGSMTDCPGFNVICRS